MMFRPLLLLCLGHCLPGANSQTIYTTGAIGGTVTLRCDGPAATDTKDVHVMWMFGGRPACWFKNGSWCETGHYVNRTRLESIRQNNFSLVINPVRKEDDGVYMCRINHKTIQSIHLNVTGGQTQTTGVTADPVCRPYTEREVSTGSEDNQDSVENHAGPPPGVIVVIVLVVLAVVAAGTAVLIKLWQKHQTDENPTDCIQFFHTCGKEGEKKRGKNLPDPGPSEDALI